MLPKTNLKKAFEVQVLNQKPKNQMFVSLFEGL